MARQFLITIREETEVDVHDIQDAITNESHRSVFGDKSLDGSVIDVQLIEEVPEQHPGNYKSLSYQVLDAC